MNIHTSPQRHQGVRFLYMLVWKGYSAESETLRAPRQLSDLSVTSLHRIQLHFGIESACDCPPCVVHPNTLEANASLLEHSYQGE